MDDLPSKTESFIKRATAINGNKFDYSKVSYVNDKTKVIIICFIHGEFLQTPDKHIYRKDGCPSCRGKRIANSKKLSVENFIIKAKEIHNGKYDYSLVEYINAHTKITINCQDHGPFKITPNNHIYGKRGRGGKNGCPICGRNNVSYSSQEWLDSLKNVNIHREFTVYILGKRFVLDGYDPITNTAYEYFGDFWHGNPEKYNDNDINPVTGTTFGELYRHTLSKIELIKNANYNLIYIWGP